MATRKPLRPLQKNGRGLSDRAKMLREMLEGHRRAVRGELDALSHSLREDHGPETWDEGDWAASVFNRELGTTRINQLTQQLDQIEAALARDAEKRYGRCAACDTAIPLARLRSLPFALYCRDCQEAAEMASAQTARAGA